MTATIPGTDRWLIESRLTREISRRYPGSWGRHHQRLAERALGLWQGGMLHEREFVLWLDGKLRRET